MPTPGTLGSAGAAGTDMAAQRVATAEQLGFTGDAALTKGQATRDPAQLKFEVETAKNPELGQGLRERINNQNAVVLQNFDHWADQTGAEAPTLRATGQAVDRALVQAMRRDKAQVNAMYAAARRTPEANAPVNVSSAVQLGEGDSAIISTPIDWINEQPSGLPNTALVDAARQYAVKLGIADLKDGQLTPRQTVTVRQMYDWRKAVGQATDYEPNAIRQSTIIKGLIDGQTEPVIGPVYRQANQARARFSQNYEDLGVIAKLMNNKRGTSDRAVALEDVFGHTVLQGSLDDLRNVRRVLHRSGPEGVQAWRELQGATVRWIQEQTTRTVATDARGNSVISAAGLDKAIRTLEADGKLDFIFGKKGAQQMRDLRDLAQYVKTVPPEAGVNTSNTAATLLSAFRTELAQRSKDPITFVDANWTGLERMRQWAEPLDLSNHQASYHVLESGDVADALLRYAEGNNVNMIILGAATHGLQMQRFVATVPIKVAMEAPCTVILVKQSLPFEALAQ